MIEGVKNSGSLAFKEYAKAHSLTKFTFGPFQQSIVLCALAYGWWSGCLYMNAGGSTEGRSLEKQEQKHFKPVLISEWPHDSEVSSNARWAFHSLSLFFIFVHHVMNP